MMPSAWAWAAIGAAVTRAARAAARLAEPRCLSPKVPDRYVANWPLAPASIRSIVCARP